MIGVLGDRTGEQNQYALWEVLTASRIILFWCVFTKVIPWSQRCHSNKWWFPVNLSRPFGTLSCFFCVKTIALNLYWKKQLLSIKLAGIDNCPINKENLNKNLLQTSASAKLSFIVVVSLPCLWIGDQQIASFNFKSKEEEILYGRSLHWKNIHIIIQWKG